MPYLQEENRVNRCETYVSLQINEKHLLSPTWSKDKNV